MFPFLHLLSWSTIQVIVQAEIGNSHLVPLHHLHIQSINRNFNSITEISTKGSRQLPSFLILEPWVIPHVNSHRRSRDLLSQQPKLSFPQQCTDPRTFSVKCQIANTFSFVDHKVSVTTQLCCCIERAGIATCKWVGVAVFNITGVFKFAEPCWLQKEFKRHHHENNPLTWLCCFPVLREKVYMLLPLEMTFMICS